MSKLLFSFLLLLSLTTVSFATSQDPDVLIYKGKTYDLFSNPLEDYYGGDESRKPKFWSAPNSVSSGNWRGYIATWEIVDDKLYLTKIDSWFCDPGTRTQTGCRRVTLRDLFGDEVSVGKVSAAWFSGKLRVPDGKQLKYVHAGYASIYERDIIFDVAGGKITGQEIIDNTKRELPSDREIYQWELDRLKQKASKNKPAVSTVPEENRPIEPFTITETGWEDVRVGTKRDVIEKALGQGDFDGRKYDDVYFVEYPKRGVQISYTNKTDEAYAIFFYNKQTYYGDFVTAPLKTDKGITWNSSPEDIIKVYGKPPRDFKDDTGNNAWRRLEYDRIDFLFESGKLTRIGVSPKNCTGFEK